MKIDVELLAKTIVKPSSQTPDHLRRHQLSSLDQVVDPIFMPWILFYPQHNKFANKERCERLKKSLADALTVFYPLAGRLKDNDYVDCNDQGVHFVEAEAKCTVQDILQDPDCSDNYKLLPFRIDTRVNDDLVAFVQVTYFQCGGMAIGIGISHKIGDVVSLVMFVNGWAAISCGKGNIELPIFDSARHFPPINASGFDTRMGMVDDDSDIVLKRFVFDASNIEALKDRYVDKESDDPNNATLRPSRIEALTAFLSSKFIDAIKSTVGGDKTLYYIYHPLNLRPRLNPPLSNQQFGNFIMLPAVAAVDNIDDADQNRCYNIISQMRNTMKDMNFDHVNRDEIFSLMKERGERERNENIVLLHFTSLCRFPVYEADFSWGRPLWVSSAHWPRYNFAGFFDTKEGGGIEVWIHLKEEVMAKFETDNELISLVSPIGGYLN